MGLGNAASGGGQGASGTTGAAGGSAAAAVGNNRKCDVCAVDMDPEHPDTADHEAHRKSTILLRLEFNSMVSFKISWSQSKTFRFLGTAG